MKKQRPWIVVLLAALLVGLAKVASVAWTISSLSPRANPWPAAIVEGLLWVGAVCGASLVVRTLWRRHVRELHRGFGGVARAVASMADSVQTAKESAVRAVNAEVLDARKKGSRHEYIQERMLERIESSLHDANGAIQFVAAQNVPARRRGARRILMITSNGAGLGHLARCLGLARQLDSETEVRIITLSTAWDVVETDRATVQYFPSKDMLGVSQQAWNLKFGKALANVLRAWQPSVVMFDGTFVYRPITQMARHYQIPLVWILRGTWKRGRENEQTTSPSHVSDALLLPTDLASGADFPISVDASPVPFLRIDPPMLVTPDDLLPREQALADLGLDEGKRYAFIQLGAGNIDDVGAKIEAALRAVEELGPEWTPVVGDSPISRKLIDIPASTVRLSRFPIARFYRAFDFVVIAAGYNAVQEVVSLGVPAVVVPNAETITDDQTRRAEALESGGLALIASDVDAIADRVSVIADPDVADQISARARSVRIAQDGSRLESWLATVVAQYRRISYSDEVETTLAE